MSFNGTCKYLIPYNAYIKSTLATVIPILQKTKLRQRWYRICSRPHGESVTEPAAHTGVCLVFSFHPISAHCPLVLKSGGMLYCNIRQDSINRTQAYMPEKARQQEHYIKWFSAAATLGRSKRKNKPKPTVEVTEEIISLNVRQEEN